MKKIIGIITFLLLTNNCYCQDSFVKIEVNKVLCIYSFLETSSKQSGTSSSFQEYIFNNLGSDEKFNEIINSYTKLNTGYFGRRDEYPENRRHNFYMYDLIWVAASNSKSIDDFSERIIGYLPHSTHITLINLFKQIEPYYDNLIWENEQENINHIKEQLNDYKNVIGHLYKKISQFYNTNWDTKVPFKIMLYPIPLESGATTATPMGNALICGVLSKKKKDKGLLGVIIHEMCHILYMEQSPNLQHQIDQWFALSDSPYSKLTYDYINEGLATALGNGWAYEQIFKKVDSSEWYGDKYIEGFSHAIFPLAKKYLSEDQPIDEDFINQSINLFEKAFPKAIYDTKILMRKVKVFANTENKDEINSILETIKENFSIRYLSFSSPINSEQSIDNIDKKETTKLFIIDSMNHKTIENLNKEFLKLDIKTPINCVDVFRDEPSKSTIIILNVADISKANNGLKLISILEYLDYNKIYEIE